MPRKRYQVKKIEGKLEKAFLKPKMMENPKKKGEQISAGGFDTEVREVDAGYMVFFPNGNSLHIWTDEEMHRQGFTTIPGKELEMDDDEGGDYEELARSRSSRVRKESFA